MKLTAMEKLSRVLITLLLLIVMSIFTSWEIGNMGSSHQGFYQEQSDNIETLQVVQFYQFVGGAIENFVASTNQYVKEKKEKYSEDVTNTRIIALLININIMVVIIVISLLVSQKNSKPVCEFMANIEKIADDELLAIHSKYKPCDKKSEKNEQIENIKRILHENVKS